MTSRPAPRAATWLLERVGGRSRFEPLIGDLVEQFEDGRSRLWYWWQAVGTLAIDLAREMVEATFPAGMLSPSHTHKSVEIIFVLSGSYEHEVNGRLYRLTPGMTGIVRPEDHVRHIVPKSGPAKVLIIWAPASEPAFFRNIHGVAIPPVEPLKADGSAP